MNLTQNDTRSCASPATRRTVTPRYNVRETNDTFVVTAHLPGVARTSLETTVDGEKLTVTGKRTFTTPENWTQVHREIPPERFPVRA